MTCQRALGTVRDLSQIGPAFPISGIVGDYSGFDPALYRTLEAKWHFSQENATSHDLQMATFESKPL
jgi:hypothetical protein